MAVRDLTARNAIEGRLWVRIYIFNFNYFLFTFFSIEFFEGFSKGGPYRRSMDWSVRWSVDPVRWTGPRTGGQCFRVTQMAFFNVEKLIIENAVYRGPETKNFPLYGRIMESG